MSMNERHEGHRLIQKTAVQKPWAQFWNPTGSAAAGGELLERTLI